VGEVLPGRDGGSNSSSTSTTRDISTEYSALMVEGGAETARGGSSFPINEPAQRQAALTDRGIFAVLRRPRRAAHRHGDRQHHPDGAGRCGHNDVSFLRVPRSYYGPACRTASARSRRTSRSLAELGILVDRDRRRLHVADLHEGRWPIGRRCSFEIIQRRALKELRQGQLQRRCSKAIEREQAKRRDFIILVSREPRKRSEGIR